MVEKVFTCSSPARPGFRQPSCRANYRRTANYPRLFNAGRLKQTEPELGRRRYTTYRAAVVTVVADGRVDVGRVEAQVVPVGATAGAAIPVVTAAASDVQAIKAGVDVTTTNKIQRSSIKFPIGVLAGAATDAILFKEIFVIINCAVTATVTVAW